MKIKHALIILVIGFFIILIGSFLKITHFIIGPIHGNSFLTLGMFVEVVGGILLVFKLITGKKSNDFLNL